MVSSAGSFAGAEEYLVLLMMALRDEHDFTVLVGDDTLPSALARYRGAGAAVEIVPGLSRHPSLRAVAAMVRGLKQMQPQLVHVNLTDQGDGMGTLLAARLSRCPVVATLHNAVPGRAAWRERLSRIFLRLPWRTIAVAGSVGRYLTDAGAECEVIHNGIFPPVPAVDARVQLGARPDRFVVCGLGRLHHQKGWDVLCRAAPLVIERCPTVEFVVLGEGDQAERLARMPGCQMVRFLGHRPAAASLLAGADLMVLPSRYEALPLSLMEAMFLGVPVIATTVGGVPEVVGDTALLVAPERPDELARAIVALVGDPDRRRHLAAQARSRAQNLFTAERMGRETAALYTLAVP